MGGRRCARRRLPDGAPVAMAKALRTPVRTLMSERPTMTPSKEPSA
ncbi:hypothetical protein GZL_09363 [Streptomyces sp. 769]|nr:hypothetical protein GZL_00050 [Streptomyces sp. 769]AJC61881.1 hypothetical protein GZL_09363 [Streptomyces sp. 769]